MSRCLLVPTILLASLGAACGSPAAPAPATPMMAKTPPPPPVKRPSANLQRLAIVRVQSLQRELDVARSRYEKGMISIVDYFAEQRKRAVAARESELPRQMRLDYLRGYRDATAEGKSTMQVRSERGSALMVDVLSLEVLNAEAEYWLAEAEEAPADALTP